MIHELKEQNIDHVVRWDEADSSVPIGLFWTYPWCITMWKHFPWVIQLDNTYKSNHFRMPLLQVTGATNVKSIFNVAFGLVDNEREDGFTWLFEQLRAFQLRHQIPDPLVYITDFDRAMKNSL